MDGVSMEVGAADEDLRAMFRSMGNPKKGDGGKGVMDLDEFPGNPALLNFDMNDEEEEFLPPSGKLPTPTPSPSLPAEKKASIVGEKKFFLGMPKAASRPKTEARVHGGSIFAHLAPPKAASSRSVHSGKLWLEKNRSEKGLQHQRKSVIIFESRGQVIFHLKKQKLENESAHNGTIFKDFEIMDPISEARNSKQKLEQSWHAGTMFQNVFTPERYQIPEGIDHFLAVYTIGDAVDALIKQNDDMEIPRRRRLLKDVFFDSGDLPTMCTRDDPYAKSVIGYIAQIAQPLAHARGSCLAVVILISSLILLDRLISKNRDGVKVTSKNVRRLLGTMLLIAAKTMDDDVNIITNKTFSALVDIPNDEMNQMELQVCLLMSFKVHVSVEEFQAYREVILRH